PGAVPDDLSGGPAARYRQNRHRRCHPVQARQLTSDEMAQMREHVTIGARILERGSSELIRTAELIAQSHHERWDGTGYPDRLSGNDIPIEARIVAIADVFDALCSERPYKAAWPIDKARSEI